jgi:hypothetical protein
MQLQFSFMTLLVGIFVVLSSTHTSVNALPLSKKEKPVVVTLPLKRVPQSRDIHPQIVCLFHSDESLSDITFAHHSPSICNSTSTAAVVALRE